MQRWLKWLHGAGGAVDKLSLFNTVIFVFVGIVNTITGILRGDNYLYYFAYSFPFLIFTVINIKTKSNHLIGIIYSAIGIISIITSNMGEFSGIVFIIFAVYLVKSIKFEIIILFLSVVSLMVSTYLDGQTTFQSFLMLSVYTYIYLIYFFTIRSDQKKLNKPSVTIPDIYISPDEKRLIQLLFSGKTRQEIYGIMGKSKTSINSYQNSLLVKLQAKTFEEALLKLGKSVKIEVNSPDDNN